MNKKASMELGVNAIIVLIIALAILGLTMSFVTTLFRKGQEQVGSIITNVNMPVRADSSEPLKCEMRELTIKPSSKTQLRVSVYNSGNFAADTDARLFLDCYDEEGTAVQESTLRIGAPPQKIPLSTDVGYGAIVISKDAGAMIYTCRVLASSAADLTGALADTSAVSGQVYITVRS